MESLSFFCDTIKAIYLNPSQELLYKFSPICSEVYVTITAVRYSWLPKAIFDFKQRREASVTSAGQTFFISMLNKQSFHEYSQLDQIIAQIC